MRTDIPGGWVELRDPKQVPERLRRPVQKAAASAASTLQNVDSVEEVASSVTPEMLDDFSHFNDLLAVALIGSWSFDAPVSVDGLLDLPGGTYDAIRELVAPLVTELMPSFEPTPDAASPIVPSNA